MRIRLLLIGLAALLAGCGLRSAKPAAPADRAFPTADAPTMIEDPAEKTEYLIVHFWDRFTDLSQAYPSDSTHVNGVAKENVDAQMGIYASVLDRVPVPVALRAVSRYYDRLEAFVRKYQDSSMFANMVEMTTRYLYDANSPLRNEEFYLPFVERLASSDLVEDNLRASFGWDARKCALNRLGTPATDFPFTDTKGRLRTLYGVQAEYVLLIFANPGCKACQEITAAMQASQRISDLVSSGRLQVVDVYIDQDVDDWKAHIADYPADWINGYDHNYSIRTDLIYNVRAIPSIYLLDAGKNVLMKDAPQEKVLGALEML